MQFVHRPLPRVDWKWAGQESDDAGTVRSADIPSHFFSDSPPSGRMTMEHLRKATSGAIDTVIVAMTGMQGRLIGKRLTARFFETDVAPQLFCDYFLATDMDMTSVPGYESASWAKGFGDFALVSGISTLRAIPWLPKTALVLADVRSSAGARPA
jgi:glutamine synthetase